MKKEELRIGNVVGVTMNGENIASKVLELSEESVIVSNREGTWTLSYGEVTPAPLSIRDACLVTALVRPIEGDMKKIEGKVAYAHQYQNLYFALTGEELNIVV